MRVGQEREIWKGEGKIGKSEREREREGKVMEIRKGERKRERGGKKER